MISDVTKAIEERKRKLICFLNNQKDDISAEKKHQLYGAINEIDVILKVIKEHKNIEIEDHIKEFKLINPKNRKFNLFKNRRG